MLITTTDTLETHVISRYYDAICAETAYGLSTMRDLLGGIRSMLSGGQGVSGREVSVLRDAALKSLVTQAEKVGANALIGLRISYFQLGRNSEVIMLSAIGTPVRAALKPGAASVEPEFPKR